MDDPSIVRTSVHGAETTILVNECLTVLNQEGRVEMICINDGFVFSEYKRRYKPHLFTL